MLFPSQGRLTISLSTIQHNYLSLSREAPSATCAAVVKANAYGLGVEPVAQTLHDAGIKDFFVAMLHEGIELRHILPQATIYVLNGILAGEEKEFITHNLIPVLNDAGMLQLWKNNGQKAIVHVDTGLNRLGFNMGEFMGLPDDAFDGLDIPILMSHLACADTNDHPMNEMQRLCLLEASKKLPQAKLSLAASDGIYCGQAFHMDMVRPGAALYGINPSPSKPNPMQPCMQLQVPILQTRIVEQDGTVGYAATYQTKKGQHLATVALGYADGFSRILSNKGNLFYKGQALPVLGRVSMDVITVDLTAIQGAKPIVGDRLEVFGPNQTPDDLAADIGTIGYEVLTALGQRFERVYTT